MDDLRKHCIMLYILYALSSVMQFNEATVLPGILVIVIAYILTSSKKDAARDTPYASHLRWMSRTFWIGTGVIAPVAIVIATFLILTLTDISSITNSINPDDPNSLLNGVQSYMEKNLVKVSCITMVTMVPTTVWWLRRCWAGYVRAKDGKPVENVTSWL